MNRALRQGDTATIEQYRPYIRVTTSGLNQLPAYRGAVYRAIEVPAHELDAVLDRYQRGLVVTERQFLSASKIKDNWGGNVEFVIGSKTGRDIEELSYTKAEAEVLFAPGARFRIVDRYFDDRKNKWIIEMDEVE